MIVIQNKFGSGIASDIREASSSSCALSKHFDFYSKPNRLTPYRDMKDEAGTLGVYKIGSVALLTDSSGTTNLYALGNVSGQTYPQFLEKSVDIITGTFAVSTTGADSSGAVLPHTLVAYKTKLFAMKTSGTSDTFLISYDPVPNTLASVGTMTGGYTSTGVYPVMFRHPQDDILYIGSGNTISKLNNTVFTAAILTLPSNLVITSLTDYGSYLAIACAPNTIGGKSYVFLWGRDTSLTTLQESVDFGEGFLSVIDMVGGTLVGISGSTFQGGATTTDITAKMVVRAYSGGVPRVIKEIKSEGAGAMVVKNFKAKAKDNLFFTASIYVNGQTVNQVWICGRNPQGEYFVNADRLANNDTALTGTVDGFSIVGDYMWTAYNGAGALKRTNDTALYTATSVYDTLINPSMPIADRTKSKQLKAVSCSFAPLPTAGQVVLQYSVDGGAYVTIFTETTDNKITTEAVKDALGSAFSSGREYRFRIQSTGGAEITELKYEYTINTTLI